MQGDIPTLLELALVLATRIVAYNRESISQLLIQWKPPNGQLMQQLTKPKVWTIYVRKNRKGMRKNVDMTKRERSVPNVLWDLLYWEEGLMNALDSKFQHLVPARTRSLLVQPMLQAYILDGSGLKKPMGFIVLTLSKKYAFRIKDRA
ncbi:hypothetical protein VNO77_33851 [Canavalia gladiata]|uniref:Uncharacterized protein n=1 Tax=Canavalia gladiata TaxID=3824 RepID=A0AAN9KF78_CANGL